MKQLKKITALVVTAAMALTLFTACVPLYLLEDFYDWFFGSGGSSASRSNSEVLNESKELEKEINNKITGTTTGTAIPSVSESDAEKLLKEVVRDFNSGWLGSNGQLSETTALQALNGLAQKYTKTIDGRATHTFVNVRELPDNLVNTYTADADSFVESLLSHGYHVYVSEISGSSHAFSGELTDSFKSAITDVKRYPVGNMTMCAGTFTKGNKKYCAFVIIAKDVGNL